MELLMITNPINLKTICATDFDILLLAGYLLCEPWQRRCVIIPDYMPPHPRDDTKPKCVVRCQLKDEAVFLRYSAGPATGTFWDVYGDDFHSQELALVELAKAPAPYPCSITFSFDIGNK